MLESVRDLDDLCDIRILPFTAVILKRSELQNHRHQKLLAGISPVGNAREQSILSASPGALP